MSAECVTRGVRSLHGSQAPLPAINTSAGLAFGTWRDMSTQSDIVRNSPASHTCASIGSVRKVHTVTLLCNAFAAAKMNVAKRLKEDVICLKSMWFAKGGGETHAERLDNFYKPQAEECTHVL